MNLRMNLREALESVKNTVVPGAVYLNSYVYFDEERNKYVYILDFTDPKSTTALLDERQLDRLVIYALNKGWVPVSNFQY